jgi:vacuolar-type H+-ATPase catalytic subunit A/Vma1
MTEKEQWDAAQEVKTTGGPAFPVRATENIVYTGISIRDYFAAKAMQALMRENYFEITARSAYLMADIMLEERLK